ncbi:MAG TPA: hypothetical protein VFF13_06775 [archaeon]|nr:hypothetical protein [archaeon]
MLEKRKPPEKHVAGAVRRGVHPNIDLDVVQRSLLKDLRKVRFVKKTFLNGNHGRYIKTVTKAVAERMGLPAETANFGLLVVNDNKGKIRATVLVPSKDEGKIDVFRIVRKKSAPNGIGFELIADEKQRFYIITSAVEAATFPKEYSDY